MGGVFFAPLDQPVRRRIAAAAVSVCANALLIALILLAPRHISATPERERALDAVEIIIFNDIPEPETAPPMEVTTPEEELVEPEPVEEVVEILVEQNAAEPVPPPVADAEIAQDAADAASEEDVEEGSDEEAPVALQAFNGEEVDLPPGRGSTQRVLRQVFCLKSSDATREAGDCPDGPSPDGEFYLRHASAENIARARTAFDLTPGQMRNAFGDIIPLADLTGQAAMSNQHSQATGAADEMRDSLPAQHPDPAFGD